MVLSKDELGGLIKEARKIRSKQIGKKYTQGMLAEDIGVSRSYLGDIETGRTYPNYVLLSKIAQACGVPLDYFSDIDNKIDSFVREQLGEYPVEVRNLVKDIIRKKDDIPLNFLSGEEEDKIKVNGLTSVDSAKNIAIDIRPDSYLINNINNLVEYKNKIKLLKTKLEQYKLSDSSNIESEELQKIIDELENNIKRFETLVYLKTKYDFTQKHVSLYNAYIDKYNEILLKAEETLNFIQEKKDSNQTLGQSDLEALEQAQQYLDVLDKMKREHEEKENILNEVQEHIDIKSFSKIPIVGMIRAGEPMLAQQNIIGYEYLPKEFSNTAEYIGLKVIGDSMNLSRINDGDIVIVRLQPLVENGETAVVLVDRENATIKRFYLTDSMVTLIPNSTNPDHQPRLIDTTKTEVKVVGKVIKVVINL